MHASSFLRFQRIRVLTFLLSLLLFLLAACSGGKPESAVEKASGDTASAAAQKPAGGSRELAEKFLDLSNISIQVDSNYKMLKAQMIQQYERSGAPPEARPVFDKFMAKVDPMLQQALKWEHTKDIYIKMVSDSFSNSELKKLVDFYSSDLGKKALGMAPKLAQRGMEQNQQRLNELQPKLAEMTKKMSTDIQAIMAKKGAPGK